MNGAGAAVGTTRPVWPSLTWPPPTRPPFFFFFFAPRARHRRHAMTALTQLPADALRGVLGQLGQDDKGACMLVSKEMLTAAMDPVLWTELVVRDPCLAAIRFFEKAVQCTTLILEGTTPDDAIWFLDQLVDRSAHTRLLHLRLDFHAVMRIPDAIMHAVCRYPALLTLHLSVHACQEECTLRLPEYFPGLRNLHTLTVREGPPTRDPSAVVTPWPHDRFLSFRMGSKPRALLPALRTLHVEVQRSDVLHALDGMPSLRHLVHLTHHETFERMQVGQGQSFDHLELATGEETVEFLMAESLQRLGAVGRYVLHARSETWLDTPVAASEIEIVMHNPDGGFPDAKAHVDFACLAACEGLRSLRVRDTRGSVPGWTVRIVNVPGTVAFLDLSMRIGLNVEVPGETEITPFDE